MRTSAADGRGWPSLFILHSKLRQQVKGCCTSPKVKWFFARRPGLLINCAFRHQPDASSHWSSHWPMVTLASAPKSTVTVLPTSQPSTNTSNELYTPASQALMFSSAQPAAEKTCAGGRDGGGGGGDGCEYIGIFLGWKRCRRRLRGGARVVGFCRMTRYARKIKLATKREDY